MLTFKIFFLLLLWTVPFGGAMSLSDLKITLQDLLDPKMFCKQFSFVTQITLKTDN